MIIALLLLAQSAFPAPPAGAGPGHYSGCLPTKEMSCIQRWIPDDEPDVIPITEPSCPDGYKVQRYREPVGQAVFAITVQPGWIDLDTSKPHEGDLRCYRPPIKK